jgi:photosystem II stability/assembly factor-like uncharacterized protein
MNALERMAVALGLAALGLAVAAGAAHWSDPLDSPAMASPLAPRAAITALARAGDRLVAAGVRGHVLWSDDGGKVWQQAQVPVSSDLTALTFPTPQQGFAVGHDGVLLESSDAARTWTRRLDGRTLGPLLVRHYRAAGDAKWLAEAERFAAQGAENPWLDIGFENADSGFVVGAFGLILHTTDGGRSWTPWLERTDNPKALHLYAVRAIGDAVYIVGEQGLALKLDRTAGRFRALAMPYAGTLFGITGRADALVVHGLRGNLLRSSDGGASWQALPATVPAGLTASTVDEQGRIVVVSQAGHVLRSADGGASFAALPTERPLPAAAVSAVRGTLVIGGPRGLASVSLR